MELFAADQEEPRLSIRRQNQPTYTQIESLPPSLAIKKREVLVLKKSKCKIKRFACSYSLNLSALSHFGG